MRTILLCVNARLLQTSAKRRVDAVRQVFLNSGCRVELVETTPFAAGPSLTRETLAKLSPDAVVVCGGDGTVFDALQSVAGTGIALGVIPFGTGNILAQNLHIRGSAASIAAALLNAEVRTVRLGAITLSGAEPARHYFLCAAGVGPHAAVLQVASQRTKQLAGKGAYWAGGIWAWLSQPPVPFEAEVTDSAGVTSAWRVCEAVALRVGELNVWRAGGHLHDAHLRLAMVPPTSRLGFAAAVSRAILARQVAVAASSTELESLLRRNRDIGSATIASAAVFYQDILRVVCRPLQNHRHDSALSVQADGEVLESVTTTLEMSDTNVHLLFPAESIQARLVT